jgi:hypothetical protein
LKAKGEFEIINANHWLLLPGHAIEGSSRRHGPSRESRQQSYGVIWLGFAEITNAGTNILALPYSEG